MAQSDTTAAKNTESASSTRQKDVIQWPKEKSQVTYMLECPVCTDFMTGVVRMCTTGHSMCNSCFSQILKQNGKCPLCRKTLPKCGGRNYFLETFAAACIFKCKFSENGCPVDVEGHEFLNHVTNCNFRDYTCRIFDLGQESDSICKNSSFLFDELVEHFTESHSVPVIENGASIRRKFYVYEDKIVPSLVLIKYDSKLFFSYCTIQPKGPVEVPTVFYYLLHRWIIKAPEQKDLSDSIGSNSATEYSYRIVTNYEKQIVPKTRQSRYLHLSCPGTQSTNSCPLFQQQGDKVGKPLLFSTFLARGNRTTTKFALEDDNSLFGFTLARGLRDTEPTEFAWKETITVSKTKA